MSLDKTAIAAEPGEHKNALEKLITPKNVAYAEIGFDSIIRAEINRLYKEGYEYTNTINEFIGLLNLSTGDIVLAEEFLYRKPSFSELKEKTRTATKTNGDWVGFYICRLRSPFDEYERAVTSYKNDAMLLSPDANIKYQKALSVIEKEVNQIIDKAEQDKVTAWNNKFNNKSSATNTDGRENQAVSVQRAPCKII